MKLLRERVASTHWPTVVGRITQSEVVEGIETDKDEDGRTKTEEMYGVDIRFAYRVEGREFHSNHWNWGWTAFYGRRARPEALVAKYPSGKEVTVYYDPAQPQLAVLDPTNKVGVAAPLLAGVFCLLSGATFLWAFTVLPTLR